MPKISHLKIGIVCYPSVGGSGIVASNLGLELAKLGHRVHFISYEKPFRLMRVNHPNIRFHQVNINKYPLFQYPDYTLPLAVAIGNVHEKYNLDILHVHYAVPHATAGLLAQNMIAECGRCHPPKLITTLHGTDITLLAQDPSLFEIIQFSIKKSDSVTAVSNYLAKATERILKINRPINVIHNFYSPGPVKKSGTAVRRELKIKPDDVLAIHLSNLRPVKRIPDLLKAAGLVKQSNFKLLIVAGGDFSPFLPLVKKFKLQSRLRLRERVADIESYINASDIGFFSSEEESFGMGVLECMAFGLPVVATKTGGTPEVLQHKHSGFLSKVGDVKALAKNLQILAEDDVLRKAMGQQAILRAQSEFSSQKIVAKYLKLYRSL